MKCLYYKVTVITELKNYLKIGKCFFGSAFNMFRRKKIKLSIYFVKNYENCH